MKTEELWTTDMMVTKTDLLPHGGRLEEARRRFPDAPYPFIDLSTGINPIAYPVPELQMSCFTRLPEPEALERLRKAAAAAYGVPGPSMVVAAPGTQALISLLPRLRGHGEVRVLSPTYAEHARAWQNCGHTVRIVTTFDDLAGADVAVLCNPNNPDGRRYARPTLMALAAQLASRGGMLVVDEAFADLERDMRSLGADLPCPGLVVLRSFGKTYGLAGVRLGFALTDNDVARAIATALGPWAVSGVAIEIGRTALADEAWRLATGQRLVADAARLDAILVRAGFDAVGGTALFRLYHVAGAAEIAADLARAGLLVRAFAEFPSWLRFGIPGDTMEWARLESALSGVRLRL